MSPTVRDGRGKRTSFAADLAVAGAGPVERRPASNEERSGFAPRVVSPRLPRATPRPAPVARAEDLTPAQAELVVDLVNADRAEHDLPLIRLADPPVTSVTREEPPMAIDPPPVPETLPVVVTNGEDRWNRESLEGLRIATTEALAAWEGVLEARHAETRWIAACKALESAYRQTGLRGPSDLPDYVPPSRIAEVLERRAARADAVVEFGSDHAETIPDAEPIGAGGPFTDEDAEEAGEPAGLLNANHALQTDAVAEPTDPDAAAAAAMATFSADRAAAAGGGPEPKGQTKQDRILAAIVPSQGSLPAIAQAVGTDVGNVNATLHNAGKRGRLTIEMRALLPAVFGKYTGV